MARLKKRLDEEYEKYRFLDVQCLKDNASRFSKEQSVLNMLLVRECSDAKMQLKVTRLEAQEVNPHAYHGAEQQEHQKVGIQHEDELLQKLFLEVLEKQGAVEERPRIGETCVLELVKERANRILAV